MEEAQTCEPVRPRTTATTLWASAAAATTGLLLGAATSAVWSSNDGSQLGALGGLSDEQNRTADHAASVAAPLFVVSVVAMLAGLCLLVVGLVARTAARRGGQRTSGAALLLAVAANLPLVMALAAIVLAKLS